jgi:hypothetical protein
MVGYTLGLVATLLASMTWRHAQPALLFLVPSTLIPVLILSIYFKEFRVLWDAMEPATTTEERGEKRV